MAEPRSARTAESPVTSTDSTQGLPQPELIRSAAFTMVYANNVSLITSPWDVRLIFGETVTDPSNKALVEQRVSITLSPQTAKALAHVLCTHLHSYENQFGEISFAPQERPSEQPSA